MGPRQDSTHRLLLTGHGIRTGSIWRASWTAQTFALDKAAGARRPGLLTEWKAVALALLMLSCQALVTV